MGHPLPKAIAVFIAMLAQPIAAQSATPQELHFEFARVCLAHPVDPAKQRAALTAEARQYQRTGEFAGGAVYEDSPVQFRLKTDRGVTICTSITSVAGVSSFDVLAADFASWNGLDPNAAEKQSATHSSWIIKRGGNEQMLDVRLVDADGLVTLTYGSIARPHAQNPIEEE